MAFRVRNWQKFQHYKNRRPPWIKLYRDLREDPHFCKLVGDRAKYLILIWLFASDTPDGTLPDSETLAYGLHVDSTTLAEILSDLHHWVYDDASGVLAGCEQVATPEKSRVETDAEADKERETEARDGVSSFEEPSNQVAATANVSERATGKMLGEQFIAKARWSGPPHKVYDQFVRMLAFHDEGAISGAIAKTPPGEPPWWVADELNGKHEPPKRKAR